MTRYADRVPAFHVGQLNVARLRTPLDDPAMAGFVEALDPVNALADRAPGFVWRLQDEHGDATSLRPWGDDVIVNLSVWESLEALRAFTFSGSHAALLRDRRDYFDPWGQGPHTVLFWVPSDHTPTLQEAHAALTRLAEGGPSPWAFTFATPAMPDPVTGLPCVVAAVQQAETRAARGEPPALVYVDVDGFAAVNDDHGRLTADGVLLELAVRLRGALPPTALLARADDDEFVVLADPGTDVAALGARLEREVAATPLAVRGDGTVRLTVRTASGPWLGTAGRSLGPLVDQLGRAGRPVLPGARREAQWLDAERDLV